MKKHFLSVFALVLAIGFVAFSSFSEIRQVATAYFVYDEGSKTDIDSYDMQPNAPLPCPGENTVCWIRVQDRTTDANNVVDEGDFNAVIDAIDSDDDGDLDEEAQVSGIFDKKS